MANIVNLILDRSIQNLAILPTSITSKDETSRSHCTAVLAAIFVGRSDDHYILLNRWVLGIVSKQDSVRVSNFMSTNAPPCLFLSDDQVHYERMQEILYC